jgi:hypothetical protein
MEAGAIAATWDAAQDLKLREEAKRADPGTPVCLVPETAYFSAYRHGCQKT